jgi:hypothetical protein
VAQTISSLTVDLIANTARFQADLGKAQKSMSRSISAMNKDVASLGEGFRMVGRLAATFGVALGVREIAQFVRSSLDAVGGLGELAQQLGIGTNALQVYQFAAVQAGVSSEQLEAGLAKLTQNIGDAAAGSATAIAAFDRLGVGVLDAEGKIRPTEAVVRDLSEALKGIKDPAARAAAEVDLFGRSGQRLDPILASGGVALDEFARQAEAAGVVLDKDMIAAADAASDAWAQLDFKIAKLSQTMVVNFLPAWETIIDGFRALADAVGGTDSVETRIASLRKALAVPFPAPFGIGVESMKAELAGLEDLQRQIARMHGYAGASPTTPPATHNPAAKSDAGAAALDRQAKAIQGVVAGLKSEYEQLSRTTDMQAVYNNLARAGVSIDSARGQEIEALTLKLASYNEGLAMFEENLQAEAEAMDKVATASKKAVTDAEGLQRELKRTSDTIAQDLGQSVGDLVTGFATWADVARNAIQAVINEMMRLNGIVGADSSGPGGWLGGALATWIGGMFGTPGLTPTTFGNLGGGNFQHMAEGGAVAAGRPYLIGERGPELFMPSGAGAIVPNHALAGAGGGDVVVNNFYDFRGAEQGVEAKVRPMIEKAKRETFAAVFEAMNRGGSHAKMAGRR